MRILVTGGTGFVGRAVARQLHSDGHEVVVGSRSGAGVDGLRGVALDVTSAEGVTRAVQDLQPEGLVHLVGIIAEQGAQTFERVHVDATRHLLAAAPPGTRLLHMSALGAREDSKSAYSSSKARAERLVRDSALAFTIFRPSLIFGPGDDFFGRVLRNLVSRAPIVPVIGDGSFPFRPVSVQDVALAFSRGLTNPATLGQTYDLTGPKEYRFDELLKLELSALGKRKPLVPVPLALMNLAVPALQILPTPPITRDQYAMLIEGNTSDPARARDTFDLPMLKLEEELPKLLRASENGGDSAKEQTASGD